jgi:hypothetical protein
MDDPVFFSPILIASSFRYCTSRMLYPAEYPLMPVDELLTVLVMQDALLRRPVRYPARGVLSRDRQQP